MLLRSQGGAETGTKVLSKVKDAKHTIVDLRFDFRGELLSFINTVQKSILV
jgi:hypothetical protein